MYSLLVIDLPSKFGGNPLKHSRLFYIDLVSVVNSTAAAF
jgi:hypothetical protein